MHDRQSPRAPARRGEEELRFRLLSGLSDELRTPIIAILGFANVLLEDERDDDRRHSLAAIRRHGEHLLLMVDDLLDLARLESGPLEVVPSEADLRLVVEATVALARGQAPDREILLQVEFEPDLPERARFDPSRLRQALGHLVSNALKFSRRGTLTVKAGFAPPRLAWVEVRDSGPGLDPDDFERLCGAFAQGGDALAGRYRGCGVGLPLARGIAASLGGSLTCRRNRAGGSTLRLEFEAEPLEPAAPENGAGGRRHWLAGRVLLAEDSPDVQRLLTRMLESAGLEVEVVADGETAVERALGEEFDLVFMDLQMPIKDGFAAARELRSRGFEQPIVALTANTAPNCRELSRAAGCDAFAAKPIDRLTLLGLAARYLGDAKTATPRARSQKSV